MSGRTADMQTVKLKKGGKTFELLVQPDSVEAYREGKLTVEQVLVTDEIFSNASKGDRARVEDLQAAFGTDVKATCIASILSTGEFQQSTEERRRKVDEKRQQIIGYIARNYVDPKTRLPHPVVRVELAFEEAKPKIDPEIPAERQAPDILKRLQGLLSFAKIADLEGSVTVPTKHIGVASSVLYKWCRVGNETYGDGCVYEVALSPADFDAFMVDLTRATGGEFEFNIAGAPTPGAAAAAAAGGSEKGGKKGGKKGGRGDEGASGSGGKKGGRRK